MDSVSLRRVIVIGSSCSGKSTLAKRLAANLGISHVELDSLYWLPNWVEREDSDFRKLVQEAVAHDAWVVDGNYSKVRQTIWPRATAVIWLNYSFALVFRRALVRTVRRSLWREPLYSGNRESFVRSFFTRDSILWWVITSFHSRRRKYEALRSANTFAHLEWIEFRRPSEAQSFFRRLESEAERQLN